MKSWLPLTVLLIFQVFACVAAAKMPCTPFRVHLQARLPPPPHLPTPERLPANWEDKIANQIGEVKTQEDFSEIYRFWLKQHPAELSERERYAWLSCLLYYVKMDTNGDGIPDWTAIIDHEPARVLYSKDPDIDGDGVPNVLDPQPLQATARKSLPSQIPPHLQMSVRNQPEAARYQQKLFSEFGILAINHTDTHSAIVLKELVKLLEDGFSKDLVRNLQGLRYIYAFLGHSPSGNVASYHREANALSVGGISSYPGPLTNDQRVALLEALAHEIGHAVLFEKLTPTELSELGMRFGGWKEAVLGVHAGFYSQSFLAPYSSQGLNPWGLEDAAAKHFFVSRYAMTNLHEWFAEMFSAAIMLKLKKRGRIRVREGKHDLNTGDQGLSKYWVNYSNVSADFQLWLSSFLERRSFGDEQ